MKKNILLLHGNSLSKKSFDYQLNDETLQKHFNLVEYELPGHGAAERNRESYNLVGLLDSITSFIKKQHLNSLSIVGHSLGGHLAIDLLQHQQDFTIEKLLLIGTPPLKQPFDPSAFLPNPSMALAFDGPMTTTQAEELALVFGSADFADCILKTDPDIRTAIGADIQSGKTYDEVNLLRQFGNASNLALLLGENDPLVNLAYIGSLNLSCWKNQPLVLPGCGHSPQYENPATFNDLLREFLSSNVADQNGPFTA